MLMKSLLSLQRSTVLVRCVNLWGEFSSFPPRSASVLDGSAARGKERIQCKGGIVGIAMGIMAEVGPAFITPV
jgi:hypothetical protein